MNLKFTSLIVIITLVISTFTSCKKDKDNPTPPPGIPASMTAMVDSTAWTAMASKITSTILNNSSVFRGIAADSSTITISIAQKVELGQTYNIGFGSLNMASYGTSTSSTDNWTTNSNSSNTGSFTITAMDTVRKRISGTFNFKGFRGSDLSFRNITNGIFTDVFYQTTTGSTSGNTFTVKVNNVNFAPTEISGFSDGSMLGIDAEDSSGDRFVSLGMPANITPGTYSIGSIFVPDSIAAFYQHDAATQTYSSSGTLVITSHNTNTNKIIGTFNFSSEGLGGLPVFNLTNGSFSVTYQE